ncbi:MAG: GDP-mannose 4,6-dehydratase [Acidobacteriota bacterium]
MVTGGCGFAGSVLVESLLGAGHRVTVLSRTGRPGQLENVQGARLKACDITEKECLKAAVEEIKPEAVYHLAARTFVPDSLADGAGFLEVNLKGTVHLLDAVRRAVPEASVLVVGSAGVYGASGRLGGLLREDAVLRPLDPYSVSKAAAEMWALQEAERRPLRIVCVRPFGHTGPGQSPRFVAADFARQVGRIRADRQPPLIQVGDLRPVREFNDVRDVAAGYVAALEKGRSGGVYNICSGHGWTIRQMLDRLLACSGVQADVETRSERLRPTEVPSLVGDPSVASADLGWTAAVPLDHTLRRLLARWGGLEPSPEIQ